MFIRKFLASAGFAVSAFLVACGGGGSSSSASVDSTLKPSLTGTIINGTSDTTQLLSTAASTSSALNYGRLITNSLYNFASSTSNYRLALASASTGITSNCTTSGTTNLKYLDAGSIGTVDAGDSWVITYANCVGSTTTTTVNGTLTVTLNSKTGASLATYGGTAWTATATVTPNITAISTSTAGGTTVITGSIPHTITVGTNNALSVDIKPTTYSTTFTPSSGSTAAATSTTAITNSTLNYSGSLYTLTAYSVSGGFAMQGTNAFVNSGAAYKVQASFPTSISGSYDITGTHQAPTAGTFKIVGASNTSATITAPFNGYNVDNNGDGSTDIVKSISPSMATAFTP